MNYYERHLGDYARDTGHLSLLEHGVYTLLLDRYYSTELPIPADMKAVHRLVRARSREEKEAVETLLEEFFHLEDDGWHHKRCDEDISRFREKSDKARRSAEARWANRPEQYERNADAYADGMRTHSEGNALQTPDTSNQDQKLKAAPHARSSQDSPASAATATDAGRACQLMRQAGCARTNPSHPALLAALAEGVTPEAIRDTAAEAVELGKTQPFAWAIHTARSRHAQGAPPPATAGPLTAQHRIAAPSRTRTALETLQARKQPDELPTAVAQERSPRRLEQARDAEP